MTGPGWPADARGWMAIGLFVEVNFIIGAMVFNPELAAVDLFKSLAQAIVLQGFLQLAAAFYFTASKGGTDMAERNQAIVEQQAQSGTPQPVTVTNTPENPVPIQGEEK